MNAYLFNAGVSQSQIRPSPDHCGQLVDSFQAWDGCLGVIVCGDDPARARAQFEAWCRFTPEGQNPIETKIKIIRLAQLVDQLFTETGGEPPDWPQIADRAHAAVPSGPEENFEPGYWVDVNAAVPPGMISPDIETLLQSLPEDIRSGLNWSPEKQYFFLISAFSPPPPPVMPGDDAGSDAENPDADALPLEVLVASRPELREKEAAAVIEARNAVVAAWLWRKYAADTRLAANDIMAAQCYSFLPPE